VGWRAGGDFWKSGRQRFHHRRIFLWRLECAEFILPHSITPRVITVFLTSSSPQRCGLPSLNTDRMHGSFSHLDNPSCVQLGPFVWRWKEIVGETSKIPSLKRRYNWPLRRTSPAFIAPGITWLLWSLRYGAGRCGSRIQAGTSYISFLPKVPTGEPPIQLVFGSFPRGKAAGARYWPLTSI